MPYRNTDLICIEFVVIVINWLKSAAKNREAIYFRVQCALSTTSPPLSTSTTAVLDIEKLRLPSLESHSNSVAAHRPWTYIGVVGPPTEVRIHLFMILNTGLRFFEQKWIVLDFILKIIYFLTFLPLWG